MINFLLNAAGAIFGAAYWIWEWAASHQTGLLVLGSGYFIAVAVGNVQKNLDLTKQRLMEIESQIDKIGDRLMCRLDDIEAKQNGERRNGTF